MLFLILEHQEVVNIKKMVKLSIYKLIYFDYIKYGPYIENLGPLNCKTTNQKFLEKRGDSWIDVTYKFQGVGII